MRTIGSEAGSSSGLSRPHASVPFLHPRKDEGGTPVPARNEPGRALGSRDGAVSLEEAVTRIQEALRRRAISRAPPPTPAPASSRSATVLAPVCANGGVPPVGVFGVEVGGTGGGRGRLRSARECSCSAESRLPAGSTRSAAAAASSWERSGGRRSRGGRRRISQGDLDELLVADGEGVGVLTVHGEDRLTPSCNRRRRAGPWRCPRSA